MYIFYFPKRGARGILVEVYPLPPNSHNFSYYYGDPDYWGGYIIYRWGGDFR